MGSKLWSPKGRGVGAPIEKAHIFIDIYITMP